MKKPRHTVSDHAVLRYLERIYGADIENVRRDIGRKIDAATRGYDGANAVNIDGVKFLIGDGGVVTTCWEQNTPQRRNGSRRSRRME